MVRIIFFEIAPAQIAGAANGSQVRAWPAFQPGDFGPLFRRNRVKAVRAELRMIFVTAETGTYWVVSPAAGSCNPEGDFWP